MMFGFHPPPVLRHRPAEHTELHSAKSRARKLPCHLAVLGRLLRARSVHAEVENSAKRRSSDSEGRQRVACPSVHQGPGEGHAAKGVKHCLGFRANSSNCRQRPFSAELIWERALSFEACCSAALIASDFGIQSPDPHSNAMFFCPPPGTTSEGLTKCR